MNLDKDGNPLVPGAMYCMAFIEPDGFENYGSLVYYGSDGKFYDADNDELVYDDFDFLVRQIGNINPDYIFTEA
jgi:hypothetical protein